jgi:hypothetical protein
VAGSLGCAQLNPDDSVYISIANGAVCAGQIEVLNQVVQECTEVEGHSSFECYTASGITSVRVRNNACNAVVKQLNTLLDHFSFSTAGHLACEFGGFVIVEADATCAEEARKLSGLITEYNLPGTVLGFDPNVALEECYLNSRCCWS